MKHTYKVLAPFIIMVLLIGGLPASQAHAATTRTVMNTNDSGAGSLRQEILVADPGDTIDFDSSLAGQTIILSDLIVIDKDLTIDGSGLSSHVKVSGGGSPDGGKVFMIGKVTVNIDHLDIIDGYYPISAGGGITSGGTLTVTNSNFSNNNANEGAAINNGSWANLTVDNCTFTGNSGNFGSSIANGNGTVLITNSTFSGNHTGSKGGSIWNWGIMTISNSTFSGDSSYDGGSINNISLLTVTDSTFSGNSATDDGGAIYNGDDGILMVKNSTFSGNSADYDGGGLTNRTTATIINSTISGNTGTFSGGIHNGVNGDLTVINSTISGNSTDYNEGGGLNNWGTLTLKNSILANSVKSYDCYNDAGGIISSNVNNLIESNGPSGYECGTPMLSVDPKLGALAKNGGPTKTHALLPDSPAIDTGDNTTCADPATVDNKDQRGVTRPIDGDNNGNADCDIGAVELQGTTGSRTLRSPAKYDGWVVESGEFTGKGGTKNNLGTVLYVGDDIADRQYRTILSFGTAPIPDNAVITKVILKVKKAGVAGTNPMNTHNGLVVDIKKGAFYNMPALQVQDFQAKANNVKAGKFPPTLYSGWYKAVLYKGAYSYINKKGLTQLRLRFLLDDDNDNISDILKLYSGNAILAKRPQLIVKYYLP